MLPLLAREVAGLLITKNLRVRWHVALQSDDLPDPHGCVKMNELIDLVPNDHWIWILDDDNRLADGMIAYLPTLFKNRPEKEAFVFSQIRRDQHGPVLHASAENMFAIGCDTAQVVFKKSLVGNDLRMREDSAIADTKFFQIMYRIAEQKFLFVDEPEVYFNGRHNPV